MRGLGGAGESSVWAQPEAAMPCLAWPCKVPRAVVRHVNASTVHGSSGYALRVFSVLSTWGLTARFDDFPTRPDCDWQRTRGRGRRVVRRRYGRYDAQKPKPERKRGRNRTGRPGAVSALSGGWGGRRSSRRGAVAPNLRLLHGALRTTPANGAGGGRDRTGPRSTRNYLLLLLNYKASSQTPVLSLSLSHPASVR